MTVGYTLWDSINRAYLDVIEKTERHDVPVEIHQAVNQLGNSMATLLQTRWDDVGQDVKDLVAIANEYNLPMDMHTSLNNLIEVMERYGLYA